MVSQYDVIIVGARPAGASLAARLGQQGVRTLLLERASLPSLPAASSPIIYSPVMKLLDETGAKESEYARGTARIQRMIGESRAFSATIRLPMAHGRDYAYAIDRARFDAALFDHAAGFASVEARQHYSVTDLLWEEGRVAGVIGRSRGGRDEAIRSRLVVGADGRFSLVARKAKAAEMDVHDEYPTSLLYAYWRGVKPYDEGGPTAVAYEGGYGYGLLVMDSADETTAVTVEGQPHLLEPGTLSAEERYLGLVRSNPQVAARLEGAEMVTRVQGMKRIGNLYRQPGGPGWALVGDAYHQHDPLDGQGIFNALFSAKSLAWAIRYWLRGEKSWAEALDWYDETVRIKTYGMYRRTLSSVRENLYSERDVPGWAIQGIRWVMEDSAMQDLMGKLLTRQIPPEVVMLSAPAVMLGAMVRGPLRNWGFGKRNLNHKGAADAKKYGGAA
jgi:flavin-dependent dehydrogenase